MHYFQGLVTHFDRFPRAAPSGPPEVEAAWLKFVQERGGLTRDEALAALEEVRAQQHQINLAKHQAEGIIDTGGTMLCVETPDGLVPGLSLVDLSGIESDDRYTHDSTGRPARTMIGNPGSEFHFGKGIDSTDFDLLQAAKLAMIIYQFALQGDINRLVVVMGTDTMAYVAATVAQMLNPPTLPIVFTGSMEAPGKPGSDAGPNFHRARFAADILDAGVYLDIGDRIIDARRASKIDTAARDAFRSLGAKDVAQHEMIEVEGRRVIGFRPLRPRIDEFHAYYRRLDELTDLIRYGNGIDPKNNLWIGNLEVESLPEYVARDFPGLDEIRRAGRLPRREDLPTWVRSSIDTAFDNQVIREHLFAGYKPEWLDELLTRADVHGIIISGIEDLEAGLCEQIKAVVRKHSALKPILLFQNPAAEETAAQQGNLTAAVDAGAFLSQRMTIEWSTVLLKRLLAHSRGVEEVKALWSSGEEISMAPYIPDVAAPTESKPPDLSNLKHTLRYIPLTFGHDPALLDAALTQAGVEGVVLGGFGAGNLPQSLLPIVQKHAERIPIIMTSLCHKGEVNTEIYGPGVAATRAGILSGGGYTWQEALLALDAVLSSERELSAVRQRWVSSDKTGSR